MRLRVDQPGVILGAQEIEQTSLALQEFSTFVYEEGAYDEPFLYVLPKADRLGEVRLAAPEASFVIHALSEVISDNNMIASQLVTEAYRGKGQPPSKEETDTYSSTLREAADSIVSYHESLERLSKAIVDTLRGSEQIVQIRQSKTL